MNQVSWLIYLANVLGNLGGFLIFLGIAVAFVGGMFVLLACCSIDSINKWAEADVKTDALKAFRKDRGRACISLIFSFVFWFMAALCPSQDTVLAIAASQFGEQLLHTKTANLAEKALNTWLEKQINQVKPAATTPDK